MNTQIVDMALVAAAFAGAGIFWMWLQVRKYGHTYTRPPVEWKKKPPEGRLSLS